MSIYDISRNAPAPIIQCSFAVCKQIIKKKKNIFLLKSFLIAYFWPPLSLLNNKMMHRINTILLTVITVRNPITQYFNIRIKTSEQYTSKYSILIIEDACFCL